jgi:hypothetical protein
MRWVFGALFVAVVLAGTYLGSAVVSLGRLVMAAQNANSAEILARTDVERVKRSLVDQIVSAYLVRTGQSRTIKPLERMLVNAYGASVADALVGRLLTEENLTRILRNGTVEADGQNPIAQFPALAELNPSRSLDLISRISPVKPVEFYVRLGAGEDSGGISLHFDGGGWKLSGVQLPVKVVHALAAKLPSK